MVKKCSLTKKRKALFAIKTMLFVDLKV